MCWSFEVSLATFSWVVLSTAVLLWRGRARGGSVDTWNAVFLAWFGSMQGIDTLLWHLHANEAPLDTCSARNRSVTFLAALVIMTEPFAALLGRAAYQRRWPSRRELLTYAGLFVVLPFSCRIFIASARCGAFDYNRPFGGNGCTRLSRSGGLLYTLGVDPHGGGACWLTHVVAGEWSEEIPLLLRLFFLLGMVYPYMSMRPRAAGLAHSAILTATWLVGLFSASHASMWCVANVAQSLLMLATHAIWVHRELTADGEPAAAGGARTGRDGEPAAAAAAGAGKRAAHRDDLHSLTRTFRANRERILGASWDAIVVGSGIGSLTTAALMAKAGRRVLVLEAHDRLGGCLHTFTECGACFDSGVHYVGNVRRLRTLLRVAGHPDHPVRWAPIDDGPTYDVIATSRDAAEDVRFRRGRTFGDDMAAAFPECADEVRRYLRHAARHTGVVTYGLLLQRLLPAESWLLRVLNAVLRLPQRIVAATRDRISDVAARFPALSPKAQAVLLRGQLIDHNEVDGAWWVSAAMLNYYRAEGGWYPVGGSHVIAESLVAAIRAAGGEAVAQAAVERIEVDDARAAVTGVTLRSGETLAAPLVVSGAGVVNTYAELLRDSDCAFAAAARATVAKHMRPGKGHMTAFIVLDGEPDELGLTGANVHHFAGAKAAGYDIVALQERVYRAPRDAQAIGDALMCLTSPSVKDRDFARRFPGTSCVAILAEGLAEWFEGEDGVDPGPNPDARSEDYLAFKALWERRFLDRLHEVFPATKGRERRVSIGTPLTAQHYLGAPRGASYGTRWHAERFRPEALALARPDPVAVLAEHAPARLHGLMLTGEGAFFGGVLGAAIGGALAAHRALGTLSFAAVVLNND